MMSIRQWLGLLTALCCGPVAFADDGERMTRVPLLSKYQQECAACHLAYPPGLLPAASWRRLMNTLPKHFGTDASLDPATVKQLAEWLTANAGRDRRVRDEPAQDRITRSAWFLRQHDDVPAATWRRPSIKSPANCMACHAGAERGDFDEDRVRIPK